MSIYEVWKNEVSLPEVAELEEIKAEHICIKPFEPEKDGYIFMHGVALAKFRDKMYCAWAHNKVLENSDDEELNYAISNDSGYTWSDFIRGNCSPEPGTAVSHGVFLNHGEKLYLFAPHFKGHMGHDMFKMGAYILNEENDSFEFAGIALDERFWPMCEPVLMENGNYIMPGIYVAEDYMSPNNRAAVAISRGSDILTWDMVKIERSDDVRVWGECSLIVDGKNCKMYCREHSGKNIALYSESNDYGKSWSIMKSSNLPMTDSKPYSGRLSNGCGYLICSCAKDIAGRNPLTIALTKKNENKFSKIYKIAEGETLSYPYAIEADNKLYVAYSSGSYGNRNSAMLAIIDMENLEA